MSTKSNVTEIDQYLRKAAGGPGYSAADRFHWVSFLETDAPEDAVPVRVKLRTSLTNFELESLQFEDKTTIQEVWPAVAPFVVEWNVRHQAEDGTQYDVIPPVEAGGGVFKYIPNSLFWQIRLLLMNAPFRFVDPKASTPSEPTPAP